MARLPRYFAKGVPQHVILRSNNREPIFANDEDCQFFKGALLDAARRYQLIIHAYVLMTNHLHLLATPATAESLPKTMQSLGRRYVQYFNYRYKRTGTLWEGRYRANGEGKSDPLVTPHSEYRRLGAGESERQKAYRELVKAPMDAECLADVRACTHKGWALGGERFKEKIERLSQRRTAPLPKGRPKAEGD